MWHSHNDNHFRKQSDCVKNETFLKKKNIQCVSEAKCCKMCANYFKSYSNKILTAVGLLFAYRGLVSLLSGRVKWQKKTLKIFF